MSNDDLQDHRTSPGLDSSGLGRVVGARVREIRTALGSSMTEFAESADISLGMLSKIEHGKAAPSLSTLVRLAKAADVAVTALVSGLDEHEIVIRRSIDDHEVGPESGRVDRNLGASRRLGQVMEPTLVTLTQRDELFGSYHHPGMEMIYMLDGSMEYAFGGERYVFGVGDVVQFHGEITHGPTALLDLPVRFMSVKVYPAPNADFGQ